MYFLALAALVAAATFFQPVKSDSFVRKEETVAETTSLIKETTRPSFRFPKKSSLLHELSKPELHHALLDAYDVMSPFLTEKQRIDYHYDDLVEDAYNFLQTGTMTHNKVHDKTLLNPLLSKFAVSSPLSHSSSSSGLFIHVFSHLVF